MNRARSPIAAWGIGLVLSLLGGVHAVSADMFVLTASLSDAEVTFNLPKDLKIGDKPLLEVRVKPVAGQPTPSRVRARIGMPEMGHWVTEEASQAFSSDGTYRFDGDFPHPGVYRFRVWLDYADGRDSKAAVDFLVARDRALEPKIVP